MGIKLKDIVVSEEIELEDLRNKVIAVDAFNFLYQFLTIIRQYDGTPLLDSKSRVTSHLSGLFFRTINFLENNIKVVYVFDGKAPELKKSEREKRNKIKEEAREEYEKAKEEEREEDLRKYAMRTARLTNEMIEQSKILLDYMGVPYINAPGEGEAQASYLVKKGDAYACASEDYDSLLFGSNVLVKNLSITGRRKLPNKPVYVKIRPERIFLDKTLSSLGINQDQFIALGLLVGTDFNNNGIPGIGPKKALKLVKEYNYDFDALFSFVKWEDFFDFSWKEVFDIFKNSDVTDDYSLDFKPLNKDKVVDYLVNEFDFSDERIVKRIDSFLEKIGGNKDLSLKKWF